MVIHKAVPHNLDVHIEDQHHVYPQIFPDIDMTL
jgi:hypothetical protein